MIVVTGASGFIGRALVADLRRRGIAVRPVVRPGSAAAPDNAVAARLDHPDDWPAVLDGAEAVVHLAAHNPAQRILGSASDAEAFRRVNVEGTATLAQQAGRAGVPRFLFASSIRVYGRAECAPFDEAAACKPDDPYAHSKLQAEEALKEALAGTGTNWTILRPPVVYGPGRGGIVGLVDRLVRSGMPVPVPTVEARRSLVYVGNLVSAIAAAVTDDRAAGQTFNVCDAGALTYEELGRLLAEIHGRRARFIRVPDAAIRIAGKVPGPGRVAARLVASCVGDDRLIRKTLGWTPPFSTAEGLRLSFCNRTSGSARPESR